MKAEAFIKTLKVEVAYPLVYNGFADVAAHGDAPEIGGMPRPSRAGLAGSQLAASAI
ncbi:MAG TPA: hypothetical protein VMB73_15420 [Acetobacteraceae bacterium]|nr:hypothetical protein [Acetobacteraceae bacterium]